MLQDICSRFEQTMGRPVDISFGPSGLMRKRIETGARADLFASADMEHPRVLHRRGLAGRTRLFARNELVAIVRAGIVVESDTLLETLLDPDIRVGTSTPNADPSGDYAWRLFQKAGVIRPGAYETLDAKAQKLTGGSISAPVPGGRNLYGWMLEQGRTDLFLTYRTNAVLAAREVTGLQVVEVPEALCVGAEYGITVMKNAPEQATGLRDFILGSEGQAVLMEHGFGLP